MIHGMLTKSTTEQSYVAKDSLVRSEWWGGLENEAQLGAPFMARVGQAVAHWTLLPGTDPLPTQHPPLNQGLAKLIPTPPTYGLLLFTFLARSPPTYGPWENAYKK